MYRDANNCPYIILSIPPIPMQEAEFYPRYLAHQLRTHLPATVVGRLLEVNEKRNSVLIETDPEGTFAEDIAKLVVEGLLGENEDLGRLVIGKFYELRGMCRSGKEIEVHGFTCFGADFGNCHFMKT